MLCHIKLQGVWVWVWVWVWRGRGRGRGAWAWAWVGVGGAGWSHHKATETRLAMTTAGPSYMPEVSAPDHTSLVF